MTAWLKPISGLYPDGHPSESAIYIGSYPDGYPSGSLLKDVDSPIMTARSSAYGYPSKPTAYIGTCSGGYSSESLLKDRGSPTMTAQSSAHRYSSESTTYIGSYLDGYPSRSLLKDGGSPTRTAIATRASQQPILGPTLMLPLEESPERWRLAHNDCSELSPWLPERVNNLYLVLP